MADAISLPFTIEGQRLKVTTSSNITHYPQDSADPDALIRWQHLERGLLPPHLLSLEILESATLQAEH
ncbi:hypothetical protein LG290_05060 [Halomonas sediminis]